MIRKLIRAEVNLFGLEDVAHDCSFAPGYEEVDEHGWSIGLGLSRTKTTPTKLPRLALNKNYLLVQLT
ncbi:MAG TPA: hypothetical protein VKB49_30395 [Candidatus Sulfotelmatobacter sp.]|nr:hypothetical protein [Candidatus Sulfotelmatobacter sp.]